MCLTSVFCRCVFLVFGVSDQVRFSPTCSTTEISQNSEVFTCSKFTYNSFQIQNNKCADQTAQIRRHVACMQENQLSRVKSQLLLVSLV